MEPRIPITDKRGSAHAPPRAAGRNPDPADAAADGALAGALDTSEAVEERREDLGSQGPSSAEEDKELHDRYLRLQAEFDNYRKRTTKQLGEASDRGVGAILQRLLPVLDDLERAIEHGEGGEGIALVYKGLKEVLESEGLEEIPALEVPFDPHVHEAVQSVDDPEVAEPMSKQVWRRGYAHRERVLRPAMVVVARPPERTDPAHDEAGPVGE